MHILAKRKIVLSKTTAYSLQKSSTKFRFKASTSDGFFNKVELFSTSVTNELAITPRGPAFSNCMDMNASVALKDFPF